ncbi:unnamed protein product [Brassica oleracea]
MESLTDDLWTMRSLGSFIEPFLTDNNQKKSIYELRGKVKAYSDFGLILIHANSNVEEKRSLYLANLVSRECVEIFLDALPIGVETNEGRWLWGLVTRTENGLLLGYKIILFERSKWRRERLSFHIYSSETGLWSLETSDFPHPFLGYYYYYPGHLISLNGNFHWLGRNIGKEEGVLSMDFYSASTGSVPCRVTYFPDLEKTTKFGRTCTPCSPTMAASDPEMVGHYQCDTWGLKRSLGSFIESFLTDKYQKSIHGRVRARAYSDVGLILIHIKSTVMEKGSLYVANPVSRECVEIILDTLPIGFEMKEYSWEWGLVTRTENGYLLGYKIVLFDNKWGDSKLSCLIYSSETGLWSLETLAISIHYPYLGNPLFLNGNLHWLALNNDNQEVVLSMDFYATGRGSNRCRVSPFPDLEKTTKFKRTCTPCQGFLMYMNITKLDGSLEDKLCVWRLRSEGWQLISKTSPGSILTGFDYLPITIDPFDAKTAYFWSTEQESLLYINLHNGKFVIHNQFEHTSDGHIMISLNDPRAMVSVKSPIIINHIIKQAYFLPFVLPQWLYRIP